MQTVLKLAAPLLDMNRDRVHLFYGFKYVLGGRGTHEDDGKTLEKILISLIGSY